MLKELVNVFVYYEVFNIIMSLVAFIMAIVVTVRFCMKNNLSDSDVDELKRYFYCCVWNGDTKLVEFTKRIGTVLSVILMLWVAMLYCCACMQNAIEYYAADHLTKEKA